jgi:hypothetical protein
MLGHSRSAHSSAPSRSRSLGCRCGRRGNGAIYVRQPTASALAGYTGSGVRLFLGILNAVLKLFDRPIRVVDRRIAVAAENLIGGVELSACSLQLLKCVMHVRESFESLGRWQISRRRGFIILLVQADLNFLDRMIDMVDGLVAMASEDIFGGLELVPRFAQSRQGIVHMHMLPMPLVEPLGGLGTA